MNRRGTEPYARWCERTAGAIPPPTRSLLFGFSQSGAGGDFSSILNIGDIFQILRYLAEFHGMPWTEVGPLYWPSTILGAMIFLLGIVFSLRGILASRTLAPHDVVATAMLLFAVGTAVMIAIGR